MEWGGGYDGRAMCIDFNEGPRVCAARTSGNVARYMRIVTGLM